MGRVITIGSDTYNTILDPFCGSGTSLVVSSKLDRKWIGCDNSIEAIENTKVRLQLLTSTNYSNLSEKEVKKLPLIWYNYEKLYGKNTDAIIEMIERGENDVVEFKESTTFNYNPKSISSKESLTDNILQAIAAFSNSKNGGIVFIGVTNDKKLVNLAIGDYSAANPQKNDRDGYQLYLEDKIKKLLGTMVALNCRITFYNIDSCDICMIEIKPSRQLVFFKDDFYIRSGNSKTKINNKIFYNYLIARSRAGIPPKLSEHQ